MRLWLLCGVRTQLWKPWERQPERKRSFASLWPSRTTRIRRLSPLLSPRDFSLRISASPCVHRNPVSASPCAGPGIYGRTAGSGQRVQRNAPQATGQVGTGKETLLIHDLSTLLEDSKVSEPPTFQNVAVTWRSNATTRSVQRRRGKPSE